ncbi:protein-disulfide isomerase [Litoreibacter halocynthiae]|uniref:Protein-disulfide isomerase n=1 Tax=Litoreibacter halocynthiae TaxID=1242689 RepID=A0A4R7LFL6_9RHOB|nr:DsbA family protein [Litoreibacter halocynthiae]TDT72710.1 protein-disulfide isomerase [Litoreibacter halocynthiae]
MRILFASIALLLLPFSAFADGLDEGRIKELVLEAIRENPEIVLEAVGIIEARESAAQAAASMQVLSSQRAALEQDTNAPVLGNPEGDVTVVEFFDYNCPYCRQVKPHMEALLAADENVRVVYREWPILGEGSVFAAKAALASREQGKYDEFHWAMMGLSGRAEEETVIRAAEQIGLDIGKLRRDMNAPEVVEHIETSMDLARTLGFNGTPSFVIGEALAPGLIDADQMIELVNQARVAN